MLARSCTSCGVSHKMKSDYETYNYFDTWRRDWAGSIARGATDYWRGGRGHCVGGNSGASGDRAAGAGLYAFGGAGIDPQEPGGVEGAAGDGCGWGAA